MDEILFPASKRGHGRASLPSAKDESQSSLFGEDPKPGNAHPATRSTDPSTSHAAEQRARENLTAKQLAVLAAFQHERATSSTGAHGMHDEALVAYYAGRRQWALETAGTRAEFAAWWPEQTASGLRTRRNELTTLGYVRDSGRKTTTIAGGPTVIWHLTPDGEAFPVRGHLERLRARARMKHGGRGADK